MANVPLVPTKNPLVPLTVAHVLKVSIVRRTNIGFLALAGNNLKTMRGRNMGWVVHPTTTATCHVHLPATAVQEAVAPPTFFCHSAGSRNLLLWLRLELTTMTKVRIMAGSFLALQATVTAACHLHPPAAAAQEGVAPLPHFLALKGP